MQAVIAERRSEKTPLGQSRVEARASTRPWLEIGAVAGVLVVTFAVFLYRLSSVVISDMDEGTYLYAGKLLTQGMMPYRDFLLAHPPLVVLMAAAWESLVGADIMAARLAYLAFVLASTIPLYLIGRRLTGSMAGGLLAVVIYTSGMLLLANMGRTIRLEPVMNAFLIAGFALYFLGGRSAKMRVLLGVVFALAVLVKLVAAVPLALLLLGDLLWAPRRDRFVLRWTPVVLGGLLILAPATAVLLAQPHFISDVFLSQVARPGLPMSLRGYYLVQDLERFPPIAIALLCAVWLVVRGRSAHLRVVALVSLGGTLGLAFAFRTFFGYYLVQILPWLAILFSVAVCAVVARVSRTRVAAVVGGLALVLGTVVPLGYEEYYYRTAHDHVSSPAAMLPLLRAEQGPLYAMYPSFALWANRPEVAWYYAADALIPRLTGEMKDAEFIQAFSSAKTVVLFEGELNDYSEASAYLAQNFTAKYQDAYYSLWERN